MLWLNRCTVVLYIHAHVSIEFGDHDQHVRDIDSRLSRLKIVNSFGVHRFPEISTLSRQQSRIALFKRAETFALSI